jgi:alpha-galactosidase
LAIAQIEVRKEFCTRRRFRYAGLRMEEVSNIPSTAVARELLGEPDTDGFAPAQAWALAPPLRFASDWRGENADLARETEVRLLWTNESLYLRFRCRYRTLTVFSDGGDSNGRRDQLWDRDVAEVFLQTDASQPRRYWEFEISPNGMWIDLEISPEGKRDPGSGMKSRVVVNESEKIWTAQLALPMHTLVNVFDPSAEWRVNFFRVEGATEPRFYSSWRPTHTAQPNFHVPEAFGTLQFQKA